jgi:HTH-type transcriptional repressor of NAD biosynthesis genes
MKKIAILGGESSGKSTLAKALSIELGGSLVEEYGREYCDMIGGVDKLTRNDLIKITEQHIKNEDMFSDGYVICDTTPLVTMWYSFQLFGGVSGKLFDLSLRKYDYYFICGNDIPFVQDGTRQDEEFRKRGFEFFCRQLEKYTVVTGSVRERIQQIKNVLRM